MIPKVDSQIRFFGFVNENPIDGAAVVHKLGTNDRGRLGTPKTAPNFFAMPSNDRAAFITRSSENFNLEPIASDSSRRSK